ncbi:hypothetical protein VB773_04075 [Haloarculaceae archaeon H-GB2-1]|nr:hypothetical protein [Haloarculaceae archaeon H-GB11]MEA5406835.1 hypothetical protein [Haloarculaceae archaeon H-GB2-1]
MRLVDGADVYQAAEFAPQETFKEITAIVEESDVILGYSSALMPFYVEVFTDRIVEAGTETTLILTEDIVDMLRTNYREELDAVLAAENCSLYRTPVINTWGVVVANGTVGVPVGDERDRLRGVIVNDSDAAVEWATEYLDDLIETNAERVT